MHVSRQFKKIVIGALASVALLYAFDDLYARVRKNQFASVQVSRMYKMKNRWNETEYSVAGREYQKCIYSLFPHFGYNPCWYLNSHPMQYINIG
jgi:hypothetical protein